MEKIAEKTFTSELVMEYSATPNVQPLGEHESTMTLYKVDDEKYILEWDIPALDDAWHIGLWTDPEDTFKIVDYDGVFSLSIEAIKFLNENGFHTLEVQ